MNNYDLWGGEYLLALHGGYIKFKYDPTVNEYVTLNFGNEFGDHPWEDTVNINKDSLVELVSDIKYNNGIRFKTLTGIDSGDSGGYDVAASVDGGELKISIITSDPSSYRITSTQIFSSPALEKLTQKLIDSTDELITNIYH